MLPSCLQVDTPVSDSAEPSEVEREIAEWEAPKILRFALEGLLRCSSTPQLLQALFCMLQQSNLPSYHARERAMVVTITFTSRDFPEGSESGVQVHRCLLQPEGAAAASNGSGGKGSREGSFENSMSHFSGDTCIDCINL
eukprot:1148468-Pelagomonas_calceolata.AAC.1